MYLNLVYRCHNYMVYKGQSLLSIKTCIYYIQHHAMNILGMHPTNLLYMGLMAISDCSNRVYLKKNFFWQYNCLKNSGPYTGISKGGFLIEAVGNPRCGGLRAQPPDAEKGLIFNVLRIASNCLNAEMHALIK